MSKLRFFVLVAALFGGGWSWSAALAQTAGAAGEASTYASDYVGDPQRGRLAFGQCGSCHAIGPRATNRTGPHLNAIVGRKAAAVDGYAYGLVMTELGLRGLVWDEDTLDVYLKRPEDLVDGTVMPHVGVASAQARADIIAYLKDPEAGRLRPAATPH